MAFTREKRIMEVQIKIEMQKFLTALKLCPKILKKNFEDGFDYSGNVFFKSWWSNKLQGPFGQNILARSKGKGIFTQFQKEIKKDSNLLNMEMKIGTQSGIPPVHEEGGTVSAGAGNIVVPLYARGEMFDSKHKLKTAFKNMAARWASGYLKGNTGLVKIKTKIGNEILVRFKTRSGDKHEIKKEDILFVLKKTVSIPKRLGFIKTFEEQRERITQILNEKVEKSLKQWKTA
jgi:hypothetical protein